MLRPQRNKWFNWDHFEGRIEVTVPQSYRVDAKTSGGDVRLLRIDGKIRASTSGGGVQCELVGTNRGIWASTSGGDVRLTVAKNITGTLDAESSGGSIRSDLPVSTHTADEHRLSGAINGGGERIYAHTSGGNITLSASSP
jgi:DUF4097 and DUF4098 domain-containing protein YvlB